MKWDDLRIFLALARSEGLSAAGRILRLDPATVGRRIARLEADVGAALFLRSPQGYTLTEAGGRLLTHAARIEAEIASGLQSLSGPEGTLSGQVRIGAPDGCATYLLPQVCRQIAETHPDLDLQIVALPRIFNLSRREADLAIAVSPPRQGRVLTRRITDYRLHLAASRAYLDRHGTPASRAALTDHRLVGYIPDMIFDTGLDYADELGAGRLHFASNSVIVQLALLRQGAGIGMVHDFALPAAPELVKVLDGEVRLQRAYHLLRHADETGAAGRLSRVADLLCDGIRRETARLEALA